MNNFPSICLILLLFSIGIFGQDTLQFNLDTLQSRLYWTGESKVTGQQNGYLLFKNSQIKMVNDKIIGQFQIDMNSLVCSDAMSSEMLFLLEGHLKSADFFDVTNHPTATIKILESKQIFDRTGRPGNYDIIGILTIKDIENIVSFNIQLKPISKGVEIRGETSIDRTKWDIRYGSETFYENIGTKLIHNQIKINFEVTGLL